ncbi:MAG: hypothetical protein HeimC2_40240 [Candidatus Heimdallarchaeota archaeon LC_2]|nr:MAG: hypothetical protein HeimC2_40240 [Candidatus Heimdallarchaeota archaeon LC_2]
MGQVTSHQYSTFTLYEKDEFVNSSNKFIENIKCNYESVNKVNWMDGNILYIINKTQISSSHHFQPYN